MNRTRVLVTSALTFALGLGLLAAPPPAAASSPSELVGPLVDAVRSFCGFYVAGAEA